MKKLKLKIMTTTKLREKLTQNLVNLAGDQEEIIVTNQGATIARIIPIYKEDREKLRERIKAEGIEI